MASIHRDHDAEIVWVMSKGVALASFAFEAFGGANNAEMAAHGYIDSLARGEQELADWPPCMVPDGGDCCPHYDILVEENNRLKEIVRAIKRDADEWCVSRMTGNLSLENKKGERLWQTIRKASAITSPILASGT